MLVIFSREKRCRPAAEAMAVVVLGFLIHKNVSAREGKRQAIIRNQLELQILKLSLAQLKP